MTDDSKPNDAKHDVRNLTGHKHPSPTRETSNVSPKRSKFTSLFASDAPDVVRQRGNVSEKTRPLGTDFHGNEMDVYKLSKANNCDTTATATAALTISPRVAFVHTDESNVGKLSKTSNFNTTTPSLAPALATTSISIVKVLSKCNPDTIGDCYSTPTTTNSNSATITSSNQTFACVETISAPSASVATEMVPSSKRFMISHVPHRVSDSEIAGVLKKYGDDVTRFPMISKLSPYYRDVPDQTTASTTVSATTTTSISTNSATITASASTTVTGQITLPDVMFYHFPCPDGLSSRMIMEDYVNERSKDTKIDYREWTHGKTPNLSGLEDKIVWPVDVSPTQEHLMTREFKSAKHIMIQDHHNNDANKATAAFIAQTPTNITMTMETGDWCAAVMLMRYLYGSNVNIPFWLDSINKGDTALVSKRTDDEKAYHAWITRPSVMRSTSLFKQAIQEDVKSATESGRKLLITRRAECENEFKQMVLTPYTWFGKPELCVAYVSASGPEMLSYITEYVFSHPTQKPIDILAIRWLGEDKIPQLSLRRPLTSKLDLSRIALRYGCGGHVAAACIQHHSILENFSVIADTARQEFRKTLPDADWDNNLRRSELNRDDRILIIHHMFKRLRNANQIKCLSRDVCAGRLYLVQIIDIAKELYETAVRDGSYKHGNVENKLGAAEIWRASMMDADSLKNQSSGGATATQNPTLFAYVNATQNPTMSTTVSTTQNPTMSATQNTKASVTYTDHSKPGRGGNKLGAVEIWSDSLTGPGSSSPPATIPFTTEVSPVSEDNQISLFHLITKIRSLFHLITKIRFDFDLDS